MASLWACNLDIASSFVCSFRRPVFSAGRLLYCVSSCWGEGERLSKQLGRDVMRQRARQRRPQERERPQSLRQQLLVRLSGAGIDQRNVDRRGCGELEPDADFLHEGAPNIIGVIAQEITRFGGDTYVENCGHANMIRPSPNTTTFRFPVRTYAFSNSFESYETITRPARTPLNERLSYACQLVLISECSQLLR